MNAISKRQEEYLFLITQEYIASGLPVGSKHLIDKFEMHTSSATVRNEMAALEKMGFLEKAHTSSGRIPSAKGFMFYVKKTRNKDVAQNIKNKLKEIFAKRTVAIDDVINEAAEAISIITDLTLVTSSDEGDHLLKSIQFVPLNETSATVVLVTSSGQVRSKLIKTPKSLQLDDVKIAIRIFKERLIDTKLKDLSFKATTLIPILEKEIKNYEFILQEVLTQVFDFHTKQTSHVYGRTNIIKNNEFKSSDKLIKIMNRLEEQSIWKSIESQSDDEDSTLKIEINNDSSLISKKIKLDNQSTEISIIGSKRMQYGQAIPILEYLEELINDKKNK